LWCQWPRFFPVRSERDDLFQGIEEELQKLLSSKAILKPMKTDHGLRCPSELRFVPRELANTAIQDLIPQPMIPQGLSIFAYVSTGYPAAALEGLQHLGVKAISEAEFLQNLANFIGNHQDIFHTMPCQWHSRLASILDPLTAKHRVLITPLPFIPLRNGTWAAPECRNVLFPLGEGDTEIPDNTGQSVVHFDAAGDDARKMLLRKLGVQDATKEEVCRIIIQAHMSKECNFQNTAAISRSDLVRHAEFLYLAGWKCRNEEDNIWVELEDGRRLRSPEVYLDSDGDCSATRMFETCRTRFPFLHQDYQMVGFSDPKSHGWLQTNLKISKIPHLVKPYSSSEDFEISPDFLFLTLERASVDVLQLVRNHWETYRKWFISPLEKGPNAAGGIQSSAYEEEPAEETPHSRTREALSSMQVRCRGGNTVELNQTYLPREGVLAALNISESGDSLASAKSPFALLDIPEPESTTWDVLQNFGVQVKVRAKHLIQCLERIKRSPVDGTTKAQVSAVYERMEKCLDYVEDGMVK